MTVASRAHGTHGGLLSPMGLGWTIAKSRPIIFKYKSATGISTSVFRKPPLRPGPRSSLQIIAERRKPSGYGSIVVFHARTLRKPMDIWTHRAPCAAPLTHKALYFRQLDVSLGEFDDLAIVSTGHGSIDLHVNGCRDGVSRTVHEQEQAAARVGAPKSTRAARRSIRTTASDVNRGHGDCWPCRLAYRLSSTLRNPLGKHRLGIGDHASPTIGCKHACTLS